jgi:hypothetical protein
MMTFYPDLHPETMLGAGERLRAVGWLQPDHNYSRGTVPIDLLTTLKQHIHSAFQPCAFGGSHDCEFCNNCKGYSNLVIPTAERVYVAPEMIVHYITEHGYRPPDEFFAALLNCPDQESPQYMALLAPYYSYFRITNPDPLPTHEQQVQLARLVSRALEDIRRLCHAGNTKAAGALANAFAELPEQLAGWGLWYRFIFSRLVRNGRQAYPEIDGYLKEYNEIFGCDTDPD